MQKKPFFTIIIPTLNEEEFLPRVLNDLVHQSEKDFEVLVIDAHSHDKTQQVASDFMNKLPLTIHSVKQANVSTQRNEGAYLAKGDYLFFLDADARINSRCIDRAKRFLEKQKALVLLPLITPQENNPQAKMLFPVINFVVEMSNSLGKPFSTGGSMIFERNFFNKIGGFDSKLFVAEDHNIIQKAYDWGVKAKMSSKINIKFSLRRMKKEGRLKLMYKYFVIIMHLLFRGDIKKQIFEYEMGGQLYKKNLKSNMKGQKLKDFMEQIKTTFIRLLTE